MVVKIVKNKLNGVTEEPGADFFLAQTVYHTASVIVVSN